MLLNIFRPKPKKTEEEIKKEFAKKREDDLIRAARLKKISLDEFSGWLDLIELLDDYILAIRKRKDATLLDSADEKTLEQLKLLDHERSILEWVKQIPQQFVNNLEARIKKEQEKENADSENKTQ